jgi:small subunit ribosomal protein S20
MPNTKGAKKALRRSQRKYVHNLRRKRAMRDAVKHVQKLVQSGKPDEANEALPEAYEAIDKAAKRGVIKDNTAARKKSRLSAFIKRASSTQ